MFPYYLDTAHILKAMKLWNILNQRCNDAHDLMIHEYGGNNRFATVDLCLDANMNLEEAHFIADRIERKVQDKFGYRLITHMDARINDLFIIKGRNNLENVLKNRTHVHFRIAGT